MLHNKLLVVRMMKIKALLNVISQRGPLDETHWKSHHAVFPPCCLIGLPAVPENGFTSMLVHWTYVSGILQCSSKHQNGAGKVPFFRMLLQQQSP